MDTVYAYSESAAQAFRRLWSRTQPIVKSPWAIGVVSFFLVYFVALFIGYHVGVHSCPSFDDLKRTHRIDENITKCNSCCCDDDKQQTLNHSLSLATLKNIYHIVLNVPVEHSQAYVHQLRYDIRKEIELFYGMNESDIPHHRRRPPVDTWNSDDDD